MQSTNAKINGVKGDTSQVLKSSNQVPSQKSSEPKKSTHSMEQTMTKRLPPIKAPVGLAKSPDLTKCRSKVGSLVNIKHNPAGGDVVIPNQKLTWNAKSKVGSLENKEHKPGGGQLLVETKKLDWKTSSKVQSLANIKHKPGGGNVKIFNDSYAKSKSNCSDNDKSNKQTGQGNNGVETKEVNKIAKDLKNMSMKN